MINLLRNALEAISGDEGDEIEMTLREGNDRAYVIIADNGQGIADVDKLFEPFYTTKAPGDGLGLGLATSASYAKDMGGILLAIGAGLAVMMIMGIYNVGSSLT